MVVQFENRTEPFVRLGSVNLAFNAVCRSVWSERVQVMSHHSIFVSTVPYSRAVSVEFTFTNFPAQP